MFCTKCGKENAPGVAFCAQCGAPLGGASGGPPAAPGATPVVPNYLVWAILSTLFCCLPLGVVSIVFATQVNGKLQAGDVAGAQHASKNAKTWAWVSFGVGLAGILIYVIVMALGIASAAMSQ